MRLISRLLQGFVVKSSSNRRSTYICVLEVCNPVAEANVEHVFLDDTLSRKSLLFQTRARAPRDGCCAERMAQQWHGNSSRIFERCHKRMALVWSPSALPPPHCCLLLEAGMGCTFKA